MFILGAGFYRRLATFFAWLALLVPSFVFVTIVFAPGLYKNASGHIPTGPERGVFLGLIIAISFASYLSTFILRGIAYLLDGRLWQ